MMRTSSPDSTAATARAAKASSRARSGVGSSESRRTRCGSSLQDLPMNGLEGWGRLDPFAAAPGAHLGSRLACDSPDAHPCCLLPSLQPLDRAHVGSPARAVRRVEGGLLQPASGQARASLCPSPIPSAGAHADPASASPTPDPRAAHHADDVQHDHGRHGADHRRCRQGVRRAGHVDRCVLPPPSRALAARRLTLSPRALVDGSPEDPAGAERRRPARAGPPARGLPAHERVGFRRRRARGRHGQEAPALCALAQLACPPGRREEESARVPPCVAFVDDRYDDPPVLTTFGAARALVAACAKEQLSDGSRAPSFPFPPVRRERVADHDLCKRQKSLSERNSTSASGLPACLRYARRRRRACNLISLARRRRRDAPAKRRCACPPSYPSSSSRPVRRPVDRSARSSSACPRPPAPSRRWPPRRPSRRPTSARRRCSSTSAACRRPRRSSRRSTASGPRSRPKRPPLLLLPARPRRPKVRPLACAALRGYEDGLG